MATKVLQQLLKGSSKLIRSLTLRKRFRPLLVNVILIIRIRPYGINPIDY
jgi:hypothetical protein